MRYITNSGGYLLQVSFGADISCNGQDCTEYTGAVPEGYDSLEAWYLKESVRLCCWKIVSGELTLDSTVSPPTGVPGAVDQVAQQGEHYGWTYRIWQSGMAECWLHASEEALDPSSYSVHSGFYYHGISVSFPLAFIEAPTVLVDGGSDIILDFLRVSNVTASGANIWIMTLENTATDTTVHYNVYAKGQINTNWNKAATATLEIINTWDIGGYCGTVTYEIGMTWAEWCESSYNTYGITASGSAVTCEEQTLVNGDDIPILGSDEMGAEVFYTYAPEEIIEK